jgi:hypothetical protein
MVKNIDSWFAFARGLGLGIEQMEEIVLVTGFHLTKSWANVVFLEGHANRHASFGVRANNDVGITWKFSPGSVRGGMRSCGPEGKVCQFVSDFEMTLAWSFALFRTCRVINAYLYEDSVLLVSPGYPWKSHRHQLPEQ